MTSGLRERRKQETRQAISDIATRLFVAHGFDEVTISQVADAAGVAKMTVTNYFARKEDLVFDRAETVIGHLAEVVAARKPGESMLSAIRRDYAAAVARADVTLGLSSPAFARMIAGSPVLTTRELEMLLLRERALGDAIAAETGTDGPQQRLAAALLASVHRVLYAEARQRSLAGQPRPEICAGWPRPPPRRSTCWSRPWEPATCAPDGPGTRLPGLTPVLAGRSHYLGDPAGQQDRRAERTVRGQRVVPGAAQFPRAGAFHPADPAGRLGDVGGPDGQLQHRLAQRRWLRRGRASHRPLRVLPDQRARPRRVQAVRGHPADRLLDHGRVDAGDEGRGLLAGAAVPGDQHHRARRSARPPAR